jgi:hypothetical protein
MRKIAPCGAATLLIFAACSAPEPQSTQMVKLQPAIDRSYAPQEAAPVSQTINIAISGMT